jgi:hypothetical protein
LQLIQYDAAGRAYRTIDNLGRIDQTDHAAAAGGTIRTNPELRRRESKGDRSDRSIFMLTDFHDDTL